MRHLKTFLIVGISLVVLTLVACQGGSTPLEANAGQDFTVVVGEVHTLDGCASKGDIVNYKWTIVTAPAGKEGDEGKVVREEGVECLFKSDTEMYSDEVGEWEVELEVRDAAGNTDTDTVTVKVVQ